MTKSINEASTYVLVTIKAFELKSNLLPLRNEIAYTYICMIVKR